MLRLIVIGLAIAMGIILAGPSHSQTNPGFNPDLSWCNVQGSLAVRGPIKWQCLQPGTSGQALLTGGPGALPTWNTVTGTGTVTSVDASGGTSGLSFSGGPITGSGTLTLGGFLNLANGGIGPVGASNTVLKSNGTAASWGQIVNGDITAGTITNTAINASAAIAPSKLAAQPSMTVLSNITGGSAVPTTPTVTALLDAAFSNTQGSVLYRNVGGWSALPPGNPGEFLRTGGSGANPAWSIVLPGSIQAPTVVNNSQLSALSTTNYAMVYRAGFAAVGDAPTTSYSASGSPCTLNAGAGDGGSQVPSADGKCWIANLMAPYDARIWGVACDGTSQTIKLQAVIDYTYSQPTGGQILSPNCTVTLGARVSFNKSAGKVVKFSGSGASSQLTHSPGFNGELVYIGSNTIVTGDSTLTMTDIQFVGIDVASSRAIKLENANLALFERVVFTNYFVAVSMTDSFSVTFRSSMWNQIGAYGIYSSTLAHHLLVDNSSFFGGLDLTTMIKLDAPSFNVIIQNNDFETGYNAVAILGGSGLIFRGNYVEYFTNQPVDFGAVHDNAVISSNWFYENGNANVMNIRNARGGEFGFNTMPVGHQGITFAATVTNMKYVYSNGHAGWVGSAPVISGCGVAPVITGTDNAGTLITGTGATACTLTFVESFLNSPICVVTADDKTVQLNSYASTTALNFTTVSSGAGYRYMCSAASGG